MKKAVIAMPALGMLFLTGCSGIGSKNASVSIVYAVAALLSILLLVGYCTLLQKKKMWFILLFSSVSVVNIGYYLLSVSQTLELALWVNRISYLGSVCLPFSMLMIILQVVGLKPPKWLPVVLGIVAAAVFFVAASPGVLTVYYRSVSLKTVSGATVLEKEYGPLHGLYLFYLMGYFVAMLTAVIQAAVKKRVNSPAHGVILLASVFVNIGVWLLEQLTRIDFELLSVSYIVSELFLLGLYMVLQESEKLIDGIRASQKKAPVKQVSCSEEFVSGLSRLTPAEKTVYQCYLDGKTTKEVLAELNITENTLKYHNRNLYGKLGVSSRKNLLEMAAAYSRTQEEAQ